MPFILLFCVLFLQLHFLSAASFAFNPMTTTHQSTKNTPSVANVTDQDDNESAEKDEFAFADDEDEFITFKNKNSFRTKLVRTMRSIKKHGAMIITAVTACAVAYVYWYKIWPFSAKLAPIVVQNENDTEEQIAEDIKDIESIEKINDTQIIQEVLLSGENVSEATNKLAFEDLMKTLNHYEPSDCLKKAQENIRAIKNKNLSVDNQTKQG